MKCEKCQENMIFFSENSTQGWSCPNCGWNIITTKISEIYNDNTEYGIYIKNVVEIDIKKIKTIAKITGVNFIEAKQILSEDNVCVFRSKAPGIKPIIAQLEEMKIQYEIIPKYNY